MRTNNIEDVIVNQIIQEVLEEAGDIRTERQKTYNNSFVECYNNYGIDYILGEVFNCSKRLQILHKSDNPDWKKIKDVRSDLINWAVLTSTCLKMEEKELTEVGRVTNDCNTNKGKEVVKIPTTNDNKHRSHLLPGQIEPDLYILKVNYEINTSELEEVTTVINGLKNIKKENIEYYDYLMRIIKFGLPKDIKILSNNYYSSIRDDRSITFYNPKPHLLLEKKVFCKKAYVLNKKVYFYYVDKWGRVYE